MVRRQVSGSDERQGGEDLFFRAEMLSYRRGSISETDGSSILSQSVERSHHPSTELRKWVQVFPGTESDLEGDSRVFALRREL